MKKITLVFFLLIVNATAKSEKNTVDVPFKLPQDLGVYLYSGTWYLGGEKVFIQIYSKDNEVQRFCKIILYDEKQRQLDLIYYNSDPLIVLPKNITNFEKKINNGSKVIKKIEFLSIERCKIAGEIFLEKEKKTLNKTLDKIFGR